MSALRTLHRQPVDRLRRAQVTGRAGQGRQSRRSAPASSRFPPAARAAPAARRRTSSARAGSAAIQASSSFSCACFDPRLPPFTSPSSMPLLIGEAVVQSLYPSGDFQRDGLVLFRELVENGQLFLRQADRPRHTPLGRLLHLRISLVPLRASRVTGHENQVPRLDAFRRDLEPVLRLERNVVLGEYSRLPVLADVGAQETPVARVPRPSPVVGLAAEYADSLGGRVDQAHVLDLHLRDLEVLQARRRTKPPCSAAHPSRTPPRAP